MTDDELRRLIKKAENIPEAYQALPGADFSEVLRDALRFRHLERFVASSFVAQGVRQTIEWRGLGLDIRESIDADMEAIR